MNIRFIPVAAVAFAASLPLMGLSASPAMAQSKMGQSKMAPAAQKRPAKMAAPVYVCKGCRTYVNAAAAKKMGYKDPMGHKLTKMTKVPAGFTDASKMGSGKMGDHKMGGKGSTDKTGEHKTSQAAPPAPAPAATLEKVVVNTCPMTSKKVEGEGVGMTVVDNYEVHFCCPGCKPAFDKLTKEQQLEKVKATLAKS